MSDAERLAMWKGIAAAVGALVMFGVIFGAVMLGQWLA